MTILVNKDTGKRASKSDLGVDGLPRDFGPNFDVEPFGFAWAIEEDAPQASSLEVVKISDTAILKNGSWVFEATAEPQPPTRVKLLIKRERDRRLLLDFEFQGKMYQRDKESVARISGVGTLALGAIVRGAQVGDYYWHGRVTPFAWIASDDSLTQMDAQTCFAFGQAAAAVETEVIFAAKALREMDPVPDDFTDDKWWS